MSFKSAEGDAEIMAPSNERDNLAANGFLLNYLGINNGPDSTHVNVPENQPSYSNAAAAGTGTGFNLQREAHIPTISTCASVAVPIGAAITAAPVGRIPSFL